MSESATAEIRPRGGVQAEETALRIGLQTLTVDILPLGENGRCPVVIGDGELGSPPALVSIKPGAVPVLLSAADFWRSRRVIDTAAWPIVV